MCQVRNIAVLAKEQKETERNRKEWKGTERKGKEGNRRERNGKERKGTERNRKEGQGREQKGKERKEPADEPVHGYYWQDSRAAVKQIHMLPI